jgi:hypothetical protein
MPSVLRETIESRLTELRDRHAITSNEIADAIEENHKLAGAIRELESMLRDMTPRPEAELPPQAETGKKRKPRAAKDQDSLPAEIRVKQYLDDHGPSSGKDLIDHCGINPPMLGTIRNQLGLLKEDGCYRLPS